MNRRLLNFLLLIPVVLTAKAGSLHNFYQENAPETRIAQPSAYNGAPNRNRTPYVYFWGSGGSVQMCRVQQQRTANFIKSPFASVNRIRAYYKSLNFSFKHYNAAYLRSCKLILFPFHDFW